MNKYTDIPLTCNHVTLLRSVVLSRIMGHYNSPRCVESKYHVKFYDRHGNEWFGSSETTETPTSTTMPLDIDSDQIGYLHSINHSMSCSIKTLPESLPSSNSILARAPPQSFSTPTFLFPEEPGSNKSLPSILEKEPRVSPGIETVLDTNIESSMEGNHDTVFVTPVLTVGNFNTSPPHGHSNAFHVVSQTQEDYDASQTSPDFNELDNEESSITTGNDGTERDNIASQVNTVFDNPADDYLAAELTSI